MMRTILLYISYDGTNFCGWQSQRKEVEERTVQGELEKALSQLHKCQVLCQGSGRTDSGVHARKQAVSFESQLDSIPVEKFPLALNSFLPKDIRVQSAIEKNSGFSARYNATSRSYRYFLSTSFSPYAFEMPYIWALYRKPNLDTLNKMAHLLKGEMDCASFAASGDQSISTKRFIFNANFFMEDEKLIFEISANAFLWKMIRTIVGTIIDYEKKFGEKAVEHFETLIRSKDRTKAGQTAPPQGLFFWDIDFDGERKHP